MKRILGLTVMFYSVFLGQPNFTNPRVFADDPHLEKLLREFKEYSGAELVFHRKDLPEGRYHDVLKPLDNSRRVDAASICVAEARMYPPMFFFEVGLKKIGVFAACASKTTSDRSRPYDHDLGGYRFFGVYNGSDAVAAALYDEGQLALTFHHEIFHHVDSTADGETGAWNLGSDDAFFQAAISGRRPYTAPPIAGDDLVALKKRRIGFTLKDAVGDYAKKNSREDQAETARHVMSMLASSLVQVIEQPELPGSQRILHVLKEYENSVPDGPGFDWFVDVALRRAQREVNTETIDQLLVRLRKLATSGQSGYAGVSKDPRAARAALKAVVRVNPNSVTSEQRGELVLLAGKITSALLQQRIHPDAQQQRFDIWGEEDANGVNRTLRRDVFRFGTDAKRLQLITSIHQPTLNPKNDSVTPFHLKNLRLVARYYLFIKSHWSVTPGTKKVFESSREMILTSLPKGNTALIANLESMNLTDLASKIPADGRMQKKPSKPANDGAGQPRG